MELTIITDAKQKLEILRTEYDTNIVEKEDIINGSRFRQAEQLAEAYNEIDRAKEQYAKLLENFYDGKVWSTDSSEYITLDEKKVFVPVIEEIKEVLK